MLYARYPQLSIINPLRANPRKWSNTLKQFVGKLPANCLSVSDHFVRLALKGLKSGIIFSMTWYECFVENQIRIRTSWG